MRLVIADTSPINYLVLIGQIDLLPALFESVVVPGAVWNELNSHQAPHAVRLWSADRPVWIEVRECPPDELDDSSLGGIDEGERAAIQLAAALGAALLIMDDRRGVAAALERGLRVTGTLGVLDLAAERGLIQFDKVIDKLEQTNFRRPQALLDALRQKHQRRLK